MALMTQGIAMMLYGSNKKWKKRYGYHNRSLSETAMYRVKQLLGGKLSLRNYNAQVGETYTLIKGMNKLTGVGMPETQYIAKELSIMVSELSNKAGVNTIQKNGALNILKSVYCLF
tara:strand:+ start:2545 stop:2892 length:348 start_codon:yes stop_codon:yes gene_type:complete